MCMHFESELRLSGRRGEIKGDVADAELKGKRHRAMLSAGEHDQSKRNEHRGLFKANMFSSFQLSISSAAEADLQHAIIGGKPSASKRHRASSVMLNVGEDDIVDRSGWLQCSHFGACFSLLCSGLWKSVVVAKMGAKRDISRRNQYEDDAQDELK